MLTGPVTILAWSFVRDDQPLGDTANQVGLALRDEIADLEAAGIAVIQVDEPALRELLPLRVEDHAAYLDWSVRSFRLSTAGVRRRHADPHAPVLLGVRRDHRRDRRPGRRRDLHRGGPLEDGDPPRHLGRPASRRGIGPGVYDIHSPRVPSEAEVERAAHRGGQGHRGRQLWVNPDCGLKTRRYEEVAPSLEHILAATRNGARHPLTHAHGPGHPRRVSGAVVRPRVGRVTIFDTVPLDQLRRRTSEKWRHYPPDVLPLFVAEMDVAATGAGGPRGHRRDAPRRHRVPGGHRVRRGDGGVRGRPVGLDGRRRRDPAGPRRDARRRRAPAARHRPGRRRRDQPTGLPAVRHVHRARGPPGARRSARSRRAARPRVSRPRVRRRPRRPAAAPRTCCATPTTPRARCTRRPSCGRSASWPPGTASGWSPTRSTLRSCSAPEAGSCPRRRRSPTRSPCTPRRRRSTWRACAPRSRYPGPEAVDDLARLPAVVADGVTHLGALAQQTAYRRGRCLAGRGARRAPAQPAAGRGPAGRAPAGPPSGHRRRRRTSRGSTCARSTRSGREPTRPGSRCTGAASRVNPGPTFGADGTGFVRLNLAASTATLTDAVTRLARALEGVATDS